MHNSVIKLRIYPDANTIEILDGQSKICNWLYNNLLETANDLLTEYCKTQDKEVGQTLYTERGLRNLIPDLKIGHAFLKVVHSSPLKNTALRLSRAIRDYQDSKKGKRKGKVTGWPNFRSWSAAWFSLFYDEPNKGFKILDNNLVLSLGKGQDGRQRSVTLAIEKASLLKDKTVKNLRISKDGKQFYAIFTIAKVLPEEKPLTKVIALDPNHKNLCYGVDNFGKAIEIMNPTWLKKYDKKIDEIKSKRDSCNKKSKLIDVLDTQGHPTGKQRWEPSIRWKHYDNVLHKVYQKRREQTKTYLYTIASKLFNTYDVVGIGDYRPHGGGITTKMRRAMNNRSLIGRFEKILSWVALKAGKYALVFDEKGTTRTCHHCQYKVPDGLAPSIREWICPNCHIEHIRDENASINGLKQVYKDLQEKGKASALHVLGSSHPLVTKRCAWRVFASGVVSRLRGKNGGKSTIARKLNRGHDSARPIIEQILQPC